MIASRLTKLEKLIGTDVGRDSAPAIDTPAMFRQAISIETDGGPKPLADVLDDWQAKDFKALDSALEVVAGRRSITPTTITRAFVERPRGHSKSSDLATMIVYALASATRPAVIVIAAADADQAKLIRHAAERIIRANPWLADLVEVQRDRITGQAGAVAHFIPADVGSSYGWTPDAIIADEVVHWGPAGERLWHSLLSSAAKRPGCVVIVASNAGSLAANGWQWQLREAARQSDDWYFCSLDGPQASWLSAKALAEQRRLLPDAVYLRLWENRWVEGGGDAIPPSDLKAAIALADQPSPGERIAASFMGVDLGIAHDASAFVIVRREQSGERVELCDVRRWLPEPGRRVSLEAVETAIIEACERWGVQSISIDPWQAVSMAERLRSRGIVVNEVQQTGPNLQRMADAIVTGFADGQIALYRDDALLADLRSLTVVERGAGWRLSAPRTKHGHADTATALALALLAARSKPQSAGVMFFDRSDVPSFASLFTEQERERLGIGAN
jgi:hypothetical protein